MEALTESQQRLLKVIRSLVDESGIARVEQAADRRPETFKALERKGLIKILGKTTIGENRLIVWRVELPDYVMRIFVEDLSSTFSLEGIDELVVTTEYGNIEITRLESGKIVVDCADAGLVVLPPGDRSKEPLVWD